LQQLCFDLQSFNETMFADMLTKASEASQNNSRRASEAFAWPPVHRKKLVSENGEGSIVM
jgi:hypothetical protein